MREPGPDHPIMISPEPRHVVVRFRGETVADTTNALRLQEANYPPVFYIPRQDARLAHYTASTHRSHCPYKGDASYFDLTAGEARAANAVWSYENPYPAMRAIENHLAFYPDKVEIEVA
jgi:uncharacterized protein (DUF427 family)